MRRRALCLLATGLAALGARADDPAPAAAGLAERLLRIGCGATAPVTEPLLRVMTLNLAHGRGDGPNQVFLGRGDFEDNLAAVGSLLADSRADIVALQEVDGPSRWSGKFDHALRLAANAAYPWHYRGDHATSFLYRYGTAVLSRLPLHASRSHRFGVTPPTPRKGLVLSEIRLPDLSPAAGHVAIDVVSVHFDYLSKRAKRRQLGELVDVLEERDRPTLLLGDFNSTWSGDSVIRDLVARTGLQPYRPAAADLATHGDGRLDWILISDEFRFQDYRVLPAVVSDHRAVVADIGFSADSPLRPTCR